MNPFVKKFVLEMEDVLSGVVNRSVYRRAWAGFSSSPYFRLRKRVCRLNGILDNRLQTWVTKLESRRSVHARMGLHLYRPFISSGFLSVNPDES